MQQDSLFLLVAAVCSAAGMWQACGGAAERGRPALAQAQEFAKVLVPLFKQIARCLNSSHFQARLPGRALSRRRLAQQPVGPFQPL